MSPLPLQLLWLLLERLWRWNKCAQTRSQLQWNKEEGKKANSTKELFEQCHRERRQQLFADHLNSIGDKDLRDAVMKACARELENLRLQVM